MMEREYFPDGTPIEPWFYDTGIPDLADLGIPYVLTDYHIYDDGKVYTKEIQDLIDQAAEKGGGVIVVPAGTYLTGSLFFRQGVNLYLSRGGVLKGSDDLSDYPLCETRIEGETCLYFPGLVNADGTDGFTICGCGTIDGNGLRSWKAFWLRRQWNPDCTNKDEQRPRLVYLSNCTNVTIADVTLQNSCFWTTHIYRCRYVKYLNCRFFSPASPVGAPSTDAIDIDVCTEVLIRNCYMEVNDDSVVLKGGKGLNADQRPENGSNERIIIEDCTYGFSYGCLTCGSESVHNRNIIMRRIHVLDGMNLLWLKMRPDTPQLYEYITVEQVTARVRSFINIHPWKQFAVCDRKTGDPSVAKNIVMRDCKCICDTCFDIEADREQYQLTDFIFEDLAVTARTDGYSENMIDRVKISNVEVTETGMPL